MRRNILMTLMAAFVMSIGFTLTSCDDDETYADQKERERKSINSFLGQGACVTELESEDTILYVPPIKVISEAQFYAQDSTTDVSKNEYVLLNSTGVYMQIVEKGIGSKVESGQTARVACRFMEFNILGDSLMCRNNYMYYIAVPDIMTVTNSYGVFTASYISGVMRNLHSTTAVPEGWLIPLSFIRVGVQTKEDENVAKVRIIVPHTSGTTDAQSNVFPCFYEITYTKV